MGFIRVNHSQFEAAASEIEDYVANHKKYMVSAGQEVTTLTSTWQGKDATQFQTQWNKVTNNDSTSHNMTKALENYAKFLRYAASQYKDAQTKAVNSANRL